MTARRTSTASSCVPRPSSFLTRAIHAVAIANGTGVVREPPALEVDPADQKRHLCRQIEDLGGRKTIANGVKTRT